MWGVLERLRSLPGVEHAALASSIPFDGVNLDTSFDLKGQPAKSPEEQHARNALVRVMSGEYLQTMGTPLLRGRAISDEDVETAQFVAVVNQEFVREYLPGKQPLGQQLEIGGKDIGMEKPYTIVGVMADAVHKNTTQLPMPEIVFSYRQIPEESLFYGLFLTSATSYVVRTRNAGAISGEIRAAVRQIAPGLLLTTCARCRRRWMAQTLTSASDFI